MTYPAHYLPGTTLILFTDIHEAIDWLFDKHYLLRDVDPDRSCTYWSYGDHMAILSDITLTLELRP